MLKTESNQIFIYRVYDKKKELNKLEYSKTPSQMSSYAYKHVFLYKHA